MFFVLPNVAKAQGYSFTLIDDGNYDFTLAAVADFDSGTFTPKTQSYGFTLLVPDGVTITFNGYSPAGTAGSPNLQQGSVLVGFDANMSDKDAYLVTTDTSGANFAAHGVGETINLVSFTVNGMPTSGALTVLDNNADLATAPALMGAFKSFIQADVIDDGSIVFDDVFVALTGTSSFNFATLGTPSFEIDDVAFKAFPIPSGDVVNVYNPSFNEYGYTVKNLVGQDMGIEGTLRSNGNTQLRLGRLDAAIYFITISDGTSKRALKVIIK